MKIGTICKQTKTLIIVTIAVLLGISLSVQARAIKRIAKTKVKIVNQSIGEPQLKDNAVGTLRVIGDDLITGAKIKNETIKNEDIAPDAAIDASKVNLSGYALSDLHQQNTDTGTNSNSFTIGSSGNDLSLLFGSSGKALTYLSSSDKFSLSKPLSLASNKITDLAAPTHDSDAATKAYVDNQLSTEIGNLKWKDPVANFAALPTCNASSDGHARLVLAENWIYRCDDSDDTWYKVANVATVNHNDLQNRDAASAHPATAISFSPTGDISSTTAQAALAEVDSEKIPLTQSFSGDVSGTYSALAIGSGKVTNAMLSGSIADSKLNQITTASKVAGSAVQLATNGGLEDSTGLKVKLDGSTLTLGASGLKVTDNTYLPLAGGTMSGDISLGTHNLTTTTGDITADTVTANSYQGSCPTGYVWVPGIAKYGTLPGFCAMKYEAKNDGSNNAVSTATGTPWVSISQTSARDKCEALGTGYHLLSDPEWMTIAAQLSNTAINDLDADANPQFPTGHSDNSPSNSLASTAGADPVVTNCDVTKNMEDASNAYSAGTCEIRGDGSYGGDDNDKGFYGTGQAWTDSGYSAGAANKSQIRTGVLPNKAVIWDIAGNVWEWTDAYVYDNDGTHEMPLPTGWKEYTSVTNYKGLNYIRPKNTSWNSGNGIGQILLDGNCAFSSVEGNDTCGVGDHYYHAFIRGGVWDITAFGGFFTLLLDHAPSYSNGVVGFRCALSQ